MRLRAWITLLALVGVLVHAIAVVRHNTVMAAAPMSAIAIATADGLETAPICHASLDDSGAPAAPAPSGPRSSCPICLGLVSAVALAPSIAALPPPVPARHLDRLAVDDQRVHVHARIRPPSRGPPALA